MCPKPRFYAGTDVLRRSPCSLNFPNLCDNIDKKQVYKNLIRKCCQFHGDSVLLTPDYYMLAPTFAMQSKFLKFMYFFQKLVSEIRKLLFASGDPLTRGFSHGFQWR